MCIFWTKKIGLPFEVDKKFKQMRTVLNKLSLEVEEEEEKEEEEEER